MSLSKKRRKDQSVSGNTFPRTVGRIGAAGFASAIAGALQKEYRGNGRAVKTIVKLTAANERAVKNWLEGRNGPSGEFLILLCRHSDQVLETVLILAGRHELVTAKQLLDAKEKLREMVAMMDELQTPKGRVR